MGGGGTSIGGHPPPITFDASDGFISLKLFKSLISIRLAPSIWMYIELFAIALISIELDLKYLNY